MPKVIYTAAKGLYQETGTGFQVNDVAILEEVQALSDPAAGAVNPYGVTTLAQTGAATASLAAPTSTEPAGTKKVLSMISYAGGGVTLVTFTGGGFTVAGGPLATVSFNAVGETYVAISNGTKWVGVAKAGATEA